MALYGVWPLELRFWAGDFGKELNQLLLIITIRCWEIIFSYSHINWIQAILDKYIGNTYPEYIKIMLNQSPQRKEHRKNDTRNSIAFFSIKKQHKNMNQLRNQTPHKNSNHLDEKHHQDLYRQKNSSSSMREMLKRIPKALEFQGDDHKLTEIRFSYIDEGLEKWKIGRLIGKGNSSVREAMNIKKGLRAAVKQVYLNQDDEKQKLKEIRVLQKLDHPNIVQYYENYKVNDQTWIFMEYVQINLRKFYLSYGSPPTPVILAFAKQILQALKYLKQKKVIHKDIKCENVLLDEGKIKLCDFGCSKDFQSTFSIQKYQQNPPAKGAKGSYLWASPESHLFAKFSFASDIWSFGCTILQLASGKFPWSQKKFENNLQVAMHIAQTQELPFVDESFDERIKQLIRCCLKRKEEQRCTVEELLQKQHLWK